MAGIGQDGLSRRIPKPIDKEPLAPVVVALSGVGAFLQNTGGGVMCVEIPTKNGYLLIDRDMFYQIGIYDHDGNGGETVLKVPTLSELPAVVEALLFAIGKPERKLGHSDVVGFQETDWAACPFCSSTKIEADTPEVSYENVFQLVRCLTCRGQWMEKYVATQRSHFEMPARN